MELCRERNAGASRRFAIARASLAMLAAAVAFVTVGPSTASALIMKWSARKAAVTHSGPSEIEIPWWSEQYSSYPLTHYIGGGGGRPSIVKVTYNAECAVVAEPGSYLSIRIALVPNGWPNTNKPIKWLEPNAGAGFTLCSALRNTGSVSVTYLPGRMAVSRQALIRLPQTDTTTYSVRVYGVLISRTGQGTWRLDDSSMAIEHKAD